RLLSGSECSRTISRSNRELSQWSAIRSNSLLSPICDRMYITFFRLPMVVYASGPGFRKGAVRAGDRIGTGAVVLPCPVLRPVIGPRAGWGGWEAVGRAFTAPK